MPNTKKSSADAGRNNDSQNKKLKTASDFEQTARDAEQERKQKQPGQSQDGGGNRHNNGRGGGK